MEIIENLLLHITECSVIAIGNLFHFIFIKSYTILMILLVVPRIGRKYHIYHHEGRHLEQYLSE